MKKIMVKPLNIWVFFILFTGGIKAQEVYTLSQAITDAKSRSALAPVYGIIDKETQAQLSNLNKKWLPQVGLSAQASYQSETTGLDLSFPGVSIPRLSKDQYKLQADISQMIYDGGTTSVLKLLQKERQALEQNGLRLEIDGVVEQTISTYFAVLETGVRIRQLDLAAQNLQAVINRSKVAIASGVMLRSEGDQLEAELIRLQSLRDEVLSAHWAALDVLGLLTGKSDPDSLATINVLPDSTINASASFLSQLDLQKNLINRNLELDQKSVLPKLAAFAQTGYGKPGLNFLKNEFEPYYIVGLRLSWQLSAFYTYHNQQQIATYAREKTDARKEELLKRKQMKYRQLMRDWQRLEKSAQQDEELVSLRQRILATTEVQLTNGSTTASTYLTKLNEVTEAMLNQEINQIKMHKNAWLMQANMGWL